MSTPINDCEMPGGAIIPDIKNHRFFSRQDAIFFGDIIEKIAAKKSVLLTGPYMSGKSTILLEVKNQIKDKYIVFIDLSIFSDQPLEKLLYSVLQEIERDPSVKEKISLNYECTNIRGPGQYEVSPVEFGYKILDILETIDKPLVLILDEIQRVGTNALNSAMRDEQVLEHFNEILRWIHERLKREPQDKMQALIYLISGVMDGNKVVDGGNSPLNIVDRIQVPDLLPEEINHFTNQSLGDLQSNFELSLKEVAEFIYSETCGTISLIQKIFSEILRKINELGDDEKITSNTLSTIADKLARHHSFDFELVIEKLDHKGKVLDLVDRVFHGEKIEYNIWHAEMREARCAGIIWHDKNGDVCIRGNIYRRILESVGLANLFMN